MRAGELTERVELLRGIAPQSIYGQKTYKEFESLGVYHAQLKNSRGYRRDESAERFADHSATFYMRITAPAVENGRLRHIGGYEYTITSVERVRRLAMKILTCERVNR